MKRFRGLYAKKQIDSAAKIVVSNSCDKNVIGEIETLSNLISIGIDTENYFGIIKELRDKIEQKTEREAFVFPYKGKITNSFIIVISTVLLITYIYCALIGAGSYYFSSSSHGLSLWILVFSFVFALMNVILILHYTSLNKFNQRFEVYRKILDKKHIEIISKLSSFSNQTVEIVTRDLNKAIKMNLIPQGHLIYENQVLVTSNEIYQDYVDNKELLDIYLMSVIAQTHQTQYDCDSTSEIECMIQEFIRKNNERVLLIKDKKMAKIITNSTEVILLLSHELKFKNDLVESVDVFSKHYIESIDRLLDEYVSRENIIFNRKKNKKIRKCIKLIVDVAIDIYYDCLAKLYTENEMTSMKQLMTNL